MTTEILSSHAALTAHLRRAVDAALVLHGQHGARIGAKLFAEGGDGCPDIGVTFMKPFSRNPAAPEPSRAYVSHDLERLVFSEGASRHAMRISGLLAAENRPSGTDPRRGPAFVPPTSLEEISNHRRIAARGLLVSAGVCVAPHA